MIYIPKIFEFGNEVEAMDLMHSFSVENLGPTIPYNMYDIVVNGIKTKARSCRVSGMSFNTWWPHHQRPLDQTESSGFLSIYTDETLSFEVSSKKDTSNAFIFPTARKIKITHDGEKLHFTIDKPGYYVLLLGDTHNALQIFVHEPITDKNFTEGKNAAGDTYYFGPGNHYASRITLRSHESLYIHPEAVVFGNICVKDVEDVHIYGGGIIDGSMEERKFQQCIYGELKPNGCVTIENSKNVSISGLVAVDSAIFQMTIIGSSEVHISNVQTVGHWRYNTDGIDFINCHDCSIKNAFVRSFDDTICVKACHGEVLCQNFVFEDIVAWCDWGHTMEIGLETECDDISNISYKNVDLIHNENAAMDIVNGHYAKVHNVRYENISVDYLANQPKNMLQREENQKYDDSISWVPIAIQIDNRKMSETYDNSTNAGVDENKDAKPGEVYDIGYKNIRIYRPIEGFRPIVRLAQFDERKEFYFHDITIDGFYINDERVTDWDRIDYMSANVIKPTLK